MNTTMDFSEQWIWDLEEPELFSSLPLLDQKAHTDIHNAVEDSDLINSTGSLLDQLENATFSTDKELFPDWMSEKMSLNFLEDIQELSNVDSDEPLPVSSLLPLENALEEEENAVDDEKSELTDLEILNQLVAYSANIQPVEGGSTVVEDSMTVDQEFWDALSATSGLPSPASSDDASLSPQSPVSSEDTDDVFVLRSPVVDTLTVIPTVTVDPLPSVDTKLVKTSPKSKARSVLKTAHGTVKPSRRERKKDQNKQAATRYREKKRTETMAIRSEVEELENRNTELKDTVESMTKEIKYLKDLLQEVLTVKGQLKEMGHSKA
ncbi:uncharacterized protein [Antedon mediterranea]|uniref:uncharacterized protein n=1 Tax=Antedon mediterranea TaxID=105859 RepID=UPI003AF6E4EE